MRVQQQQFWKQQQQLPAVSIKCELTTDVNFSESDDAKMNELDSEEQTQKTCLLRSISSWTDIILTNC